MELSGTPPVVHRFLQLWNTGAKKFLLIHTGIISDKNLDYNQN